MESIWNYLMVQYVLHINLKTIKILGGKQIITNIEKLRYILLLKANDFVLKMILDDYIY